MSNLMRDITSMLSGQEIAKKWVDILEELDGSETPVKQTETEQEIKSRLLAKLNRREGA